MKNAIQKIFRRKKKEEYYCDMCGSNDIKSKFEVLVNMNTGKNTIWISLYNKKCMNCGELNNNNRREKL